MKPTSLRSWVLSALIEERFPSKNNLCCRLWHFTQLASPGCPLQHEEGTRVWPYKFLYSKSCLNLSLQMMSWESQMKPSLLRISTRSSVMFELVCPLSINLYCLRWRLTQRARCWFSGNVWGTKGCPCIFLNVLNCSKWRFHFFSWNELKRFPAMLAELFNDIGREADPFGFSFKSKEESAIATSHRSERGFGCIIRSWAWESWESELFDGIERHLGCRYDPGTKGW